MAKEPEKPEETEAAPPAGETAAAEETVMDAMMSGPKDGAGYNIDAMMNVGLNVQIVLGKTRMPISQLLKLSRGSIIELDKKIGEPVDIVINDRLVARGDLVKLDEDRIGVSLIEIVKDYVSEK
ncbi:flagellar motor switch protein FliN [Pseudooceanicola nitratireducens]|uniref:flagellar motor switch protein FliN n=1 Tax=Pseudooceanicola nitratireducens TaxID=517719 RepID=UPI003C7B051B